MPRDKKSGKRGKKGETSPSSSSSSSSFTNNSAAVPTDVESQNSKDQYATAELTAASKSSNADVESKKVDEKREIPSIRVTESAAGSDDVPGASRRLVMQQLNEKLTKCIKPRFDELELRDAEKKLAKLTGMAKVGAPPQETGKTMNGPLTAAKTAPAITGEKPANKPGVASKDEKSGVVNGAKCATNAASSWENASFLKCKRDECQKMVDLRGALSAELNYRFQLGKVRCWS